MDKFCVEGVTVNPKCASFTRFDFQSEEQIFDILLDVLKSELPVRLSNIKDCEDKAMYIAEEDIDLIPSGKSAHFSLILNPLSDLPEYSAEFMHRTVVYNFELILTVQNELARCITWELIRFKNAIEGLILGSEFAIDGYDSVDVEPKGFAYFPPEADGGIFRRQGAYRFAVTVTQYKIN
jgi:hypothetical protein